MRMRVAIMPGLLVAIVTAGRNEFVQYGRQVALQTRLELDRAHSSLTTDIKNMYKPSFDSGRCNDSGDLLGKVLQVSMSLGREEDLLLMGHLVDLKYLLIEWGINKSD